MVRTSEGLTISELGLYPLNHEVRLDVPGLGRFIAAGQSRQGNVVQLMGNREMTAVVSTAFSKSKGLISGDFGLMHEFGQDEIVILTVDPVRGSGESGIIAADRFVTNCFQAIRGLGDAYSAVEHIRTVAYATHDKIKDGDAAFTFGLWSFGGEGPSLTMMGDCGWAYIKGFGFMPRFDDIDLMKKLGFWKIIDDENRYVPYQVGWHNPTRQGLWVDGDSYLNITGSFRGRKALIGTDFLTKLGRFTEGQLPVGKPALLESILDQPNPARAAVEYSTQVGDDAFIVACQFY